MRANDHQPAVRTRGLLLVGGAAVLWGTSGLSATVAYDYGVHPVTVSFWRMALGAVLLATLLRSGRRPVAAARSLGRREVLARLAGVGIGLATYQAGYFLAVAGAGVSIATLVTLGLAPVLVTVAEHLRGGDRTPRATTVGVVLAVAGLGALVGFPQRASAGVLVGVALAAVSAGGYAGLTIVGGDLSARLGSQRLTAMAFAAAALVLLPVVTLVGGLSVAREPIALAALVYLAVVPTAVAYRWFFSGLESTPASAAAVLALLEPLVATAIAVPLLGERLTPIGWVGAAALVAAVVLTSWTSRSTESRPTPAGGAGYPTRRD